jgi:hypothetical protein
MHSSIKLAQLSSSHVSASKLVRYVSVFPHSVHRNFTCSYNTRSIAGTVPELQSTFIEQVLTPGSHVSLHCSATSSPEPQFSWFLDGEILAVSSLGNKYAIGQYVGQAGDVISHLNISNFMIQDGGLYTCKATNSLGSVTNAARLSILGR